jgi:hypothetical protein
MMKERKVAGFRCRVSGRKGLGQRAKGMGHGVKGSVLPGGIKWCDEEKKEKGITKDE